MNNLIIITGKQGSGKTTHSLKHYNSFYIIDNATHKDYKKVIESIFERDTTVVVCDISNYHIFIPKSKNIKYKIVKL